ncbi:hypothetical protein GON03_14115 [Nocardioides sp. MAH-18]|uniref:STAS domain-containing protein n=1 Tax=Nocardioides agri TaxID=2682843 RepID=A0A6L6XV05_9ACTN|nr:MULTISPECIES: hypothetical protein [unclassified Nocardioides]MBA2955466.1 hypothetical protein [Nocardioides sp. CGMCC 1.13656]MVQ50316.1 hypothetical protein [Nocardioides sp. MAH-18]
MLVTAADGQAWFRSQPGTGTLRLGGVIGHGSYDLIPAIVVALQGDTCWRELNLDEVRLLSPPGAQLVDAICRLAREHGTPLRLTCRPSTRVHGVLEAAHLAPVRGPVEAAAGHAG